MGSLSLTMEGVNGERPSGREAEEELAHQDGRIGTSERQVLASLEAWSWVYVLKDGRKSTGESAWKRPHDPPIPHSYVSEPFSCLSVRVSGWRGGF